MSRHSKNNTASSVFTYHERKSIKGYGSIHERLGTESLRYFEQCWICLKPAVDPVATPTGYLYCRECIIFNFGQQRQQWKDNNKAENNPDVPEGSPDEASIDAFLKGQALLDKQGTLSIKGRDSEDQHVGLSEHSDEERETKDMSERIKKQQERKRKRQVEAGGSLNPPSVSFWAPHETHTGRANLELLGAKRPKKKSGNEKLVLQCPISKSPLRLKDLIPIRPTVERTDDGKTKWICSTSLKELAMQEVVLLKESGELMLKSVWRELGSEASAAAVIDMKSGESIFSSHNKVEINLFRPNIG
eukprot:Protomagalhaensia_sp_Gyna_25__5617@NODE_780_length_2634_cov_136_451252_g612_i0_p1_GENE_NODE_780_length_2634_cov_136_451252_g612_i0NODE_780_length_2634_cov_136_451252_g612_i0_p1_ORF_typecomplete_len303_score55_29zfNOSIP/PF15906_5/3_1e30zfNOSIP/PF15906_5/1_6e04zfC3HC4_4/PF15227_6/1_3e05Rtf2/PF04641_12/52Rtf2/PF04641_12/1_3e02Rtf2/PF04641_12/0_0011zfRING_UBOX/PF13445_6/4_2e05zfRING_UBOX/PF13445_6/3_8e03Ubox/PF04564_15/0_0044Ubox/PF04564_15/1_1e02zfC3HC4_3/PF13920_6/0_00023zfC3HC4_3/PF13920_6/6_7e03